MLSESRNFGRHDLTDTAVIVLCEAEFASTDDAAIQRLRQRLIQAAGRATRRNLILDIGEVRHYGAAFLAALIPVAQHLRRRGGGLFVVGDRWDLIRRSGLDAFIGVCSDGHEAASADETTLCHA